MLDLKSFPSPTPDVETISMKPNAHVLLCHSERKGNHLELNQQFRRSKDARRENYLVETHQE